MQVSVQAKLMEVEMDVNIAKNGGGSYRGTRIVYRDAEGSLKEQNIHSNALRFNPGLKQSIIGLSPGDAFTMLKEKEGEFWNVKSISKGVVQEAVSTKAGATSEGKASTSPRSTYETPEERARRQVLIVRQSSVSSAIAYAATQKSPMKIEEILKIAAQINDFVFDNESGDGSIDDIESDVL
jgi:hypothetical protein